MVEYVSAYKTFLSRRKFSLKLKPNSLQLFADETSSAAFVPPKPWVVVNDRRSVYEWDELPRSPFGYFDQPFCLLALHSAEHDLVRALKGPKDILERVSNVSPEAFCQRKERVLWRIRDRDNGLSRWTFLGTQCSREDFEAVRVPSLFAQASKAASGGDLDGVVDVVRDLAFFERDRPKPLRLFEWLEEVSAELCGLDPIVYDYFVWTHPRVRRDGRQITVPEEYVLGPDGASRLRAIVHAEHASRIRPSLP